jgi:hypothetical protein
MTKRPLPVAVLCILGAIAAAMAIVILSVNALWVVPPSAGQRAVAFGATALVLTALYGLWRMKRWSVLLVGTLLLVRVVYGLAAHLPWNPPVLVLPVLLLLAGLAYRRQMT